MLSALSRGFIVEKNVGVSVETLEDEVDVVAGENFRSDVEGGLIFPVGLANPLQLSIRCHDRKDRQLVCCSEDPCGHNPARSRSATRPYQPREIANQSGQVS